MAFRKSKTEKQIDDARAAVVADPERFAKYRAAREERESCVRCGQSTGHAGGCLG